MATNTAASFTDLTGNGTAGPFNVSFSYLSEAEVDVTVGGVAKTLGTHYTFTSADRITFTSGNEPANGVAIKFQRDTDISSKKVDFVDGSVLTETDLDTNTEQLLFGLQEVTDFTNEQLSSISNSLKVSVNNTVDSGSVTGAVERTLTDKLADIVNVADFGAKGDGVTDDTLSLQNAINFCITNSGKELQLNAGVYVLTQNLLATIDAQFEQLHIKGNGNVIFKCIPTLTTLSTIAIANKNTGAINTSTDADFSSVVGNVSIQASNSSASGNSGGFNTGQNYILFSEAGSGSSSSGSERSIAFAPIDASNLGGNGKVTRIEIDAIVGTDNNGGEHPDVSTPAADGEYLELRYSTDNGANFNLIGQIIPIQDKTLMSQTVTQYFIDIPTAAQGSNVIFQLHQPDNTGVDHYGITNIRYLNLSADNFLDVTITSNHYASGYSTGAPRFSIKNIEFAYANQTQSVLATGINLKGSNITGQHTQLCVIENCQFVPWTNTANSALFESFFSAAVKINDLHEVSFKNCSFYGEFDPEGTTPINNVFGRTAGTVNGQSGISVFITSTDNTKKLGNYYFDTCTFLYGLYGIYNGPYAFSLYINNCLFQQMTTGIYIDTIDTNVDTTFVNGSVLRITNSVFSSETKQSDPPLATNALNSHYCVITSGSLDIQIANSLFVSGANLNSNPTGARSRGCLYLSDSGRINISGNNFISVGAGANNTNIYSYANYKNTGIVIDNPNVSSTSVDSLIQGNNFYGFASAWAAVYLTSTSKEIQCYAELNVFNDCGNNIYNLGTNNITSLPSTSTTLDALTNVTLSSPSNGQVLKYNGSAWVNGTDASGAGATDLSYTANGTSLYVNSSTGNNVSLPAATTSAWGVMTDEDKTNLDANTAKVTNATHTGDVTGATALTIANDAVTTDKIADDAVTADKLANSINTEIAANTAKVSNATHTGDVTGATSLTIANDAVTTDKINLISTSSVPSLEAKGDGSSQDGYIQLNCSQNSHGIKLKSPPHSANASYTLTFPNTDGNANQVLKTDGSGGLDWVDQTTNTDTTYSAGTGLTLTGTTFSVDTLNQNTTGSAATLTTPRAINGVNFDGSADITIADSTKMPLAGGTFTGTIIVEDAINETIFAITDASSVALDPDNGMVQTWTLGANRTATDSLTTGQSMLLIITASSSNYTLTWPTMKWNGGSAPTLGGSDPTAIELFKVGSQLYGATVGDLS